MTMHYQGHTAVLKKWKSLSSWKEWSWNSFQTAHTWWKRRKLPETHQLHIQENKRQSHTYILMHTHSEYVMHNISPESIVVSFLGLTLHFPGAMKQDHWEDFWNRNITLFWVVNKGSSEWLMFCPPLLKCKGANQLTPRRIQLLLCPPLSVGFIQLSLQIS